MQTVKMSMKQGRETVCIDMRNDGANSCEIVALRKNFVDRPESYDSFSAKSCVFLAHGLGHISPFPYHKLTKSKVSKNS